MLVSTKDWAVAGMLDGGWTVTFRRSSPWFADRAHLDAPRR